MSERLKHTARLLGGQKVAKGHERFFHEILLFSFIDYELESFDSEKGRVEPGPNPFAPDKLLTMCPE